jgi:hypothetical protein
MLTPPGYHDDGDVDVSGTPRPARSGGDTAGGRLWWPSASGQAHHPHDHRVLQAPDAPLFGSKSPIKAGTLRGAVFATVGLIITMALVILESQTGVLPAWWPAVLTPLLIQILRIWEAYIDQVASG